MKNLIACACIGVLLLSCNNEKTETVVAADTVVSAKPVMLAYTPSYSSSFEAANPELTAPVVKGSWKDWENNTLDNMRDWVADTIVAFHSDNTTVSGIDSLMARWKRGRAEYTSVIDTIQAVTSLHSTDKNENWVLVWAKEINTKADGTIDTAFVQETWRINKDGKADMLLQYDRAKRKK
jgi:hypothetical protein